MKDGFITVSPRSPHIEPCDVTANIDAIIADVTQAYEYDSARIIVLPELCVSGYSCGDMFLQAALLRSCEQALQHFLEQTAHIDALIALGCPVSYHSKLYNCAIVAHKGSILGIVPKRAIPTYDEFYELRHFSRGFDTPVYIDFAGKTHIPFGIRQIFSCTSMPLLRVAVEICEDVWVANPPSSDHVRAGATLILNLSATPAQVNKSRYRRSLIAQQSARCICGYVYACAPWSESTQDVVFSAHNMVAENGTILAESSGFSETPIFTQIDLTSLDVQRRRTSTFEVFDPNMPSAPQYSYQQFELELEPCHLTRYIDPHPFVPHDPSERAHRCEEILSIQAHGLAKRMLHTHSQTLVLGLSGGLDSTLALLVCVRACACIDLSSSAIIAVTMPGFGTTQRTHGNAAVLADALGATLREISIVAAVRQHFADIGHSEEDKDVTYENAQARERTQILMDIANQESGLVVGTGDLSEFALGWATYNADHMSMYAVNAGVPKTLVRYVVQYEADRAASGSDTNGVYDVLLDILDTPVSPELLPAQSDGTIAQKTEDLVGPYELHDFFLYYVLRKAAAPHVIYRLARHAFEGTYDDATILMWLRTFYRRFFSQQFKRSCMCDGPKVGTVALSPRGDLRMPSDAHVQLWLADLEHLTS